MCRLRHLYSSILFFFCQHFFVLLDTFYKHKTNMLRKRHRHDILYSWKGGKKMNMGQKIKSLREQKGMTLEELGDKVGVGKSTVRKWETGMIANMKRDKIAKLAKALEVSPSYLMDWEENLTEQNSNLIPDILSDSILFEHIKKLMKLNKIHQQTIYDNIAYWYEKEGH